MSRYKIDIVSQVDGRVVFDALVTEMPPREVLNALSNAALTVRRANQPGHVGDAPLYRADDPARSISAALDFAARRDTAIGRVLALLIRESPRWVSREAIRHAGGDSGDRRVREIRSAGWPVESKRLDDQLDSVRLPLDELQGKLL